MAATLKKFNYVLYIKHVIKILYINGVYNRKLVVADATLVTTIN